MDKILLIVPHLGRGGQEKIAAETANILVKNYEVDMAVFERVDNEYSQNANLIVLNAKASSNLFYKIYSVGKRNFALKKIKKENNYIVSYSFGDIANVSNVLSRHKEKCLTSIHGYSSIPKNSIIKMIYGWILSKSTSVLCVSQQITEELKKIIKDKEKVITLYNPYDIDKINKLKEPPVVYDENTFVAVGRIEKIKGYENLIYSFKIATLSNPNIFLKFIGEGSQRKKLESLVKELGIENHIEFLGLKENPYPYISKAKAFVLTSFSEGFPNAMIEALACKVPVISVDCPSGPKEILSHNYMEQLTDIKIEKCGILTPPFKEADSIKEKQIKQAQFAKAILYMIENTDYYSLCCANALSLAQKFDVKQYENKLIKLF